MGSLYFNEDNHPELLSIALKGEYLKEFLMLFRENVDAMKSSPLFASGEKIYNKLSTKVAKGLDSEEGNKYGIDARDLEELIYLVTETAVPLRSAPVGIIPDRAVPKHEYMAQVITESLMQEFSACLAVQEHKEAEYLKMALKGYSERFELVKERITHLKYEGFPGDFKTQMDINAMVKQVLMNMIYCQQRENRMSPVAKISKQIVYGTNPSLGMDGMLGEVREVMAIAYSLDVSKSADRLKLKNIEKMAFKNASEELNCPLPNELGG